MTGEIRKLEDGERNVIIPVEEGMIIYAKGKSDEMLLGIDKVHEENTVTVRYEDGVTDIMTLAELFDEYWAINPYEVRFFTQEHPDIFGKL